MSALTSADFDRLDQLTAMLAVIPKVTESGRNLLSAEQQKDAHVRVAKLAQYDALAAQAAARKATEACELAHRAAEDAKVEADRHAKQVALQATEQAADIVGQAKGVAAELLASARQVVEDAQQEAATIRATITAERAELAKLEAKAAKIREQLKKMIGE